MERLTFEGNFCDICRCDGEYRMTSECADGPCSQRKVWEKLKAYEDTGLTPEAAMALAEAQREGRLLVAPRNMAEKRVYADTVPVKDLYDEDGGDVLP